MKETYNVMIIYIYILYNSRICIYMIVEFDDLRSAKWLKRSGRQNLQSEGYSAETIRIKECQF